MHDIKAIRADPDKFDAELNRRSAEEFYASSYLIPNDTSIREKRHHRDELLTRRNELSDLVGKALWAADSGVIDELKSRVDRLKDTLSYVLSELELSEQQLTDQLAALPNLPAPDVPDGLDESANLLVHARGTPPTFPFTPREHDTLALRFGYDPETAAAIAGARFAVLTGPLARLHRALGQFMLDRAVAAGFTEVAPPLLVKGEALFGVGQLPKFEDDVFKTTDTPPRYLIPTAEVSLTNLVRGKTLDLTDLPLRFTALTPCFRAEAGSAGRDTRGLIRQHQFDKVEIVSITPPDHVSDLDGEMVGEHERMTRHAESILDALGLPYRRMLLCAGDMGFSARRTFDLEVWLPGQGAYREISSVSDCGDFQARRMDMNEPKGGRYKIKGQKGTHFVHTLNGSALAVGRTLVAVIENYQRADGSVAVPEVLGPYMGGVGELRPS